MSLKNNFIVAANRAAARLWGMCLRRGIIAFDDDDLLRTILDGKSWDDFWKTFTTEFAGHFFYSPRNQKDFFLQTLLSLHPYEEILDDANDAARRTFDLLGSGPVTLATPLPWNVDFKTGAAWENAWYETIKRSNEIPNGEIKIPWELGRMQFLVWLGKGYWASNSRRYVDAFRDFMNEWIDANPMGRGLQWSNAMEAAIRAANMIAGMAFFLNEQTLDEKFWRRALATLWRHGEFIENNLEVTRRSGNHLIANYTGLVFLGALFHASDSGQRWFAEGVRGVEREILRQTTSDGVDYEKSIPYHRFVTEMALAVMLLCRHMRAPFRADVATRIEAMCEFAAHYSRDDGSVPNIGDNDNGRLFRFRSGENFLDHTSLLSTAAVAFYSADFKSAAGRFAEETLWLTGGAGWERFMTLEASPKKISYAFREGGFFVMRSEKIHCIVDTGELGKHGWGGHGHNDTLSFEFWNGAPVIVDSGTFCYTSDAAARSAFRGTAAHNTPMIDEQELAEFDGAFKIKFDATRPVVKRWESTAECDVLIAEHFAYAQLADPVVHTRTFTFDKKNHTLEIIDAFRCNGNHTIAIPFHFAAEIALELVNPTTLKYSREQISGTIHSTHDWRLEECMLSPSYGIKIKSMRAVLHVECSGNLIVKTFLNGGS